MTAPVLNPRRAACASTPTVRQARSAFSFIRLDTGMALAATLGLLLMTVMLPARAAHATPIERVVSPGGIIAWLVSDRTVPVIAVDFAFAGGTTQDAAAKAGTAYMAAQLLDEGAGDLDSQAFRDRLERRAIEMGFNATRDQLRGNMRTLSENRDEAFELLRLALNAPRFDTEPVERVRAQILSMLRRQSTEPNDLASKRWWATAFGDHPYGRPTAGTLDTVPQISADDMRGYVRRVLARDGLVIAVVGDIDAATLGPMLDRVFGTLPAKGSVEPVAAVAPVIGPQTVTVPLDVPQSVIAYGGRGIARSDPDFMAAYVVNHIIGGGPMTSRLYEEVREKRGLAYSVYQGLTWLKGTALFTGATATRGDRASETMDIIRSELTRMANEGPTAKELEDAKSYLKGSQMLALDTSTKIAGQLVQYQIDNLGIDYIDRRNGLIDAVTLEDARRVAKRLLGDGIAMTIVGRENTPQAPPSVPVAPAKDQPPTTRMH